MAFGTAWLALSALSVTVSAGTAPADVSPPGRTLSRFHVTALRPPGLVRAVAQGPDGQLWVGTDRGLRRFDGRRFAPVGGEGVRDGVGEEDISALRFDGRGRLWVGTNTGKLLRLAGPVVETISPPGGPPGAPTAFLFDGSESGWMVALGTLFRLDAGTWSPFALQPAIGPVHQLWQGQGGAVIVEGRRGWVRVGRDQAVAPLSAGLGWSPAHVARRSELVAEAMGVAPSSALAGRLVTAALRSGPRVFFGTVDGLFILDGTEMIALHVAQGLPDNHVRALAEDAEGGVWVATHGGGLARVAVPAIAAVGMREGLAGNTPFSVTAARDGSIWAGSVGGLTRIQGDTIFNVGRRPGFRPAVTRSVLAAADGSVWVTQLSSTLLRYLPEDDSFVEHVLPGVPPADDVTLLFEEASGALLVGTTTGALFRFQDGTFTTLAPGTPGCQPHAVGDGYRCPFAMNVAFPRRSGGVYLGSYGKGLTVLDQDRLGPWRSLAVRPGEGEPVVTALHEDEVGTLWVGTSHSLRVARGSTVKIVPLGDDGEGIFGFQPDGADRVWLPVSRGILRTTRKDLLALAEGAPATPAARYTIADGLTSDLTMGAFDSPVARAADGRLWFVNVTGLTLVDPARLPRVAPPTTIIDEVETGNRKLYWPALPRALSVSPPDRDLLFRFSAPSLHAPHRLQYRHRLDGVDAKWVDTRDGESVRYVHLDPGRYIFRVSARRVDGGDFGPEAVLAVTVTPRFHETGTARALLVLVLLVLVWLALRLRARQVTARFLAVNAERQRIGLDLHDTLAQVFTAVGLQVDAVEGAIERGSSDVPDRIRRVRQMLRHGRHAARAVISNLRAPPGDGAAALPRSLEGLSALYPDLKLAVTVTGSPFALGASRNNEVIWIVEQAVSNAVEHGRARHVGIELAYEEDRFVAWIRDDGQGFTAGKGDDSVAGHFGLRGMDERARRAGGELIVESCPGAGTEIGIIMPKDRMAGRSR